MSNDEYGQSGNFFYSENLETRYSSKSFTLSQNIVETITWSKSGPYVAGYPSNSDSSRFFLSQNWYIEAPDSKRYERSYIDNPTAWLSSINWPLFIADAGYTNSVLVGTSFVAIKQNNIDVFTLNSLPDTILDSNSFAVNPWLTSNTGWTVWAWRTTWTSWASHSSGTASLLQSYALWAWRQLRLSWLITGWTTGTIVVKYNGITLYNWTSADNQLFKTAMATQASWNFEFVPSNTFNGTVKYVDARLIKATAQINAVTLAATTARHPALFFWFLYIASVNKIDVIDTTTRTIKSTLILGPDDSISALTVIGNTIYIYTDATDRWRQYMWNGIDSTPAEVVVWNSKPIIWAKNDGNYDYIVCWDNSANNVSFRKVQGYNKTMIHSSWIIYPSNSQWKKDNKDKIYQRFDFMPLYTKSMDLWNDIVSIPGYNWRIYTFGSRHPYNSYSNNTFPESTEISWAGNWWTTYMTMSSFDSVTTWTSYTRVISGNTQNIYGTICRQDQDYFASYTGTGYLITNPLLWDNQSSIKQLRRLTLWYKLPSQYTSINIYARIDDYWFYTLNVSGVTNVPVIGDTYSITYSTEPTILKVIATNITWGIWTITCIFQSWPTFQKQLSSVALTRVTWIGDASITITNGDNFILLKTLTTTSFTQWRATLFGNDFITTYLTDYRKIQFKIELITTDSNYAPEVFDLPILSDFIDDVTYN